MAYPLISVEGAVTSWGAAGMYSAIIAAITSQEATMVIAGEPQDATPFGQAYDTQKAGLRSVTGTIRGKAFAAPLLGNVGLVTYASGYAALAHSWSMTLEAGVFDWTQFSGSPTWRAKLPDRMRWNGTYSCNVDNATDIVHLTPAGTASAAATFKFGDDDTLAGNIIATRLSQRMAVGSLQTVEYGFTGDGVLTPAGTGNPLGSSALGRPLWSQGGATTNTLLTLTAVTGSTYTVDAFWNRIQITCEVGSLVDFQIDWTGNGAVAGTGIS